MQLQRELWIAAQNDDTKMVRVIAEELHKLLRQQLEHSNFNAEDEIPPVAAD